MNMMFVFNSNKKLIGFVSNNGASPIAPFFNDLFKQDLITGADTYEFTTINNSHTSRIIQPGNYVLFFYDNKYKMFQIVEQKHEHNSGKKYMTSYCEGVGLELLTDYAEPFTIEGNFKLFLETVLQDTEWRVGNISESLLHKTSLVKNTKNEKVYKLIQDSISNFGVELEFRIEFVKNKVAGMYIDAYADGERGRKTYKRFEYGDNVISINKKVNIYDFASAGIGEGQDSINFKDVEWKKSNGDPTDKPLGQDFVVNHIANDSFNKGKKYIKKTYNFNTKDKRELLRLTYEALLKDGEPKTDYEVNLGLRGEEYKSIRIGDTVYVIDFDYFPSVMLEARVGVLEISFTDPRKNKCILSNYKEVQSKIKSFSKEDIMNEVLDYISRLELGILTEADMKILRDYMEKMSFTKEEIDSLFSKYQNIIVNGINVKGSSIDITLDDKRYYRCDLLDKLVLKVANNTNSKFKSIIEFSTKYDCYPIKLEQSNDIWMTGEDCKNGILINKADTKYRITVTYINNVGYPRKFKGQVEVLNRGSQSYKVPAKFSKADQLITLSLQYYNNRGLFKYNQLTPLTYHSQGKKPSDYASNWKTGGLFHIDCSTFVNQLFRARGYDNSIYKNLTYGMSSSVKYGWGFDIGRTASAQAEWCIKNGYQLNISTTNESAWWNLLPGDLVFWSARTESSETNVESRYMQVSHVAVVRTPKNSNNQTTTMEVTTNSDVVLNRTLQNNFPEKILFFARVRR
ncbi:phage tail protein [Terrisporobacter sp.]|uniref:phage tail protein n=1 Tax=Terrisporobacter sp. TaxID=1965305 RepID=UPI0028A21F4F|nr:phage tail protein [Terrisporobacter sp.]